MDQVLHLLKSARGSMTRETWCIETRNDGQGGRCIIGHIENAKNRGEYPQWVMDQAMIALSSAIPPARMNEVFEGVKTRLRSHGFMEVTTKTTSEWLVATYNNQSNYEVVSRWLDRVICIRELADLGVPEIKELPVG